MDVVVVVHMRLLAAKSYKWLKPSSRTHIPKSNWSNQQACPMMSNNTMKGMRALDPLTGDGEHLPVEDPHPLSAIEDLDHEVQLAEKNGAVDHGVQRIEDQGCINPGAHRIVIKDGTDLLGDLIQEDPDLVVPF